VFQKHIIYTTFEERSRLDASHRYWWASVERYEHLKIIVRQYGAYPYMFTVQTALRRADHLTDPLVFTYVGQKIRVDDLAYFLKHLSSFVEAAQDK